MLKALKEKEKKAKSKRKTTQKSQFATPYVILITRYAKTLGPLNSRYELLSIAVTYNLASITKMGYKNNNNNGIFVKIRGTQDKDVNGEEQGEQAHDPDTLSLTQLMEVLVEIQLSLGHLNSRFNSMDEHLDSMGA